MRTRVVAPILAAVLGLAALAGAAPAEHQDVPPDESFKEYVPGASRLEGRLLAPCCWDSSRQTLDIHGSPIANELRREIRTRLRHGESPDDVEADLVRRYTTKILAVPPDSPLPQMGSVLVVALGAAGLFAASRVARWRKKGHEVSTPAVAGGAPVRDQWDAQIDSALEEEDE